MGSTVLKTITLTEQQDAWIAAQISAGLYTNDSEAIRDLIQREQARSVEVETIRQAVTEGEQSGEPEQFDFAAFKRRKSAQRPLRTFGDRFGVPESGYRPGLVRTQIL